ncbi:NIPSNAP domain-containing protein [Nocardia sp. NPDC059240]|uniref:NIPSNAP domain-containing protein n=1 Tax=Nocardia sp. NPDC059240 TaxID=3346786 RepID=UPI003696CB27
MSRSYELRVYTLATAEALDTYRRIHYPRHLVSFLAYGIGAHGIWTNTDDGYRLYALLSFAAGVDPAEVAERYLRSPELRSDMAGFDVSAILAVTSTRLTPSPGSALL